MAQQEDSFKKIVSHAKEYGFVFPSSEIYDGLSAVYDYGQNGVELKNNIKRYWWDAMTLLHENIVGIDSAIFMHPTIWKASGHVDAFNDPLIDNRDSKKRYRADVLIEEEIAKMDDKIEKEVAKARKRFGENFDEALFRETNPRVQDIPALRSCPPSPQGRCRCRYPHGKNKYMPFPYLVPSCCIPSDECRACICHPGVPLLQNLNFLPVVRVHMYRDMRSGACNLA